MANLHVRIWLLPRAHTFDEISYMMVGGIFGLNLLCFHPKALWSRATGLVKILACIGLWFGINLKTNAVAKQCPIGAIECFTVRTIVFTPHAVVFHSGHASSRAVSIDVDRLVTENEAGILVRDLQYIRHLTIVLEREPVARSIDTQRGFNAHNLLYSVEAMSAKVRDPAACVVPEPPKIAQEATLVKGHLGSWTEVEIPIQSWGWIRVWNMTNPMGKHVYKVPYSNITYFSQFAALDDALYLPVVRR